MNTKSLFCPRCKNVPIRRIPVCNKNGVLLRNKLRCRKCGLKASEIINTRIWRLVNSLRIRQHLELLTIARNFRTEFETAMTQALDEDAYFYKLAELNAVKLLNFRVLLEKHRVSLKQLIEVIVRIRPPRGTGSIPQLFGLSIAQMCGPAFFGKIEKELAKTYPAGETVAAWQSQVQTELLFQVANLPKNLPYAERIRKLSALRDKLERQSRERPFRGNPWTQ